MQYFTDLGYEIEHFGGMEYQICAVPGNLYNINKKELFIEILDNLSELSGRNNPDLMVATASSGQFADVMYREGLFCSQGQLHADETETSKMLVIAPETVHMDKAVDCVPEVPRGYLSYGSIFRASPGGVWGNPTKATAEKGQKLLERCAELVAEELKRAFAYMEAKEKFNYSDF